MQTEPTATAREYVRSFDQICKDDVTECGGKGANLGELTRIGMRVPPGFCIVSEALGYVLRDNDLEAGIAEIAAGLRYDESQALETDTARIRELIVSATIPRDLEQAIRSRYRSLVAGDNGYVAVRSSVAVKDSEVSSFPGLMDTYHYVRGEDETLSRIRRCWASVWTARAAFVRHEQGIGHDRALIAPLVQTMIDAECAGVMFTANPVTGARDEIIVEANWGIGESVVSGAAVSDYFVLDGATLATKTARISKKTIMVTMDRALGAGRIEQDVPQELAGAATLSEAQLAELGATAKTIEHHFGFEADIEWAYRGSDLFVLQARKLRNLASPRPL